MPTPSSETSVNSSAPKPTEQARLISLNHLFDEWDADAQARADAKATGKPMGAVSGLRALDNALGGHFEPGLHIVHGVPGVGKTAFALQIAASCQCPCLYVTAEMSPLELLRRITARVTKTFLGKFKTGELPPSLSGQYVREAVAVVPHLALLDATHAPAKPQQIFDIANEDLPNLAPNNPHRLIVIDSLNSWSDGLDMDAPEYETLNYALSELREIAGRLACPIVAIAERNRVSMDKGGLSAGAGTRKIEYGSASVIDLDMKSDATEDANGEKPLTFRLAKNRNGATTRPKELLFHGALQRFREPDTY